MLENLRRLGVTISMDDFGTGFSSLGYLRTFPFDKLKIDQSFVQSLGPDRRSHKIISAIASLGQSFGMTTVAEGVETAAQYEVVAQEGCSEVQGKIYSMPMTADEHSFVYRGSEKRGRAVGKRRGFDAADCVRRCRETAESHAACVLRRGVRRPAPATVYHAYILYANNMLNRAIWRNEANSSESSGFPRLSADFFPSILIFLVDSERRQAPQRPPLPLDLTAAPFHPSKSPQRRSQLAITKSEMGAVISPRLLSAAMRKVSAALKSEEGAPATLGRSDKTCGPIGRSYGGAVNNGCRGMRRSKQDPLPLAQRDLRPPR